MLRAGYTTTARLLDGSGQEVTIRWYEVPDTAPTLGLPSKVMSLNWHARPWQVRGIGEVFGAPRPFSRWRPPGGAPAGHVCGDPQWYLTGVPVDPERPAVEYGPDGLPLCCQPQIAAVLLGGRAVIPTQSPGVVLGGSARVGPGGAALLGGSAPAVRASGAALLGGSAPAARASGAALLGGSAEIGTPPVPECLAADDVTLGTLVFGFTTGAPLYRWWEVTDGVYPADHRVEWSGGTGSTVVEIHTGSDCSSAVVAAAGSGASGCISVEIPSGVRWWISVSDPGGGVVILGLTASSGTCP